MGILFEPPYIVYCIKHNPHVTWYNYNYTACICRVDQLVLHVVEELMSQIAKHPKQESLCSTKWLQTSEVLRLELEAITNRQWSNQQHSLADVRPGQTLTDWH